MSRCLCVLTDGSDELVEAAKGKQRFWELSQEKLQSSCDHMDLLPLSIVQVKVLLCRDDRDVKTTVTAVKTARRRRGEKPGKNWQNLTV